MAAEGCGPLTQFTQTEASFERITILGGDRLSDLIRDLKYALRRLFRTPGFTFAAVITLALGIGANTAIFSLIDGVLIKPLPFPESDRLIGVWQTAPGVNIKDLNACIADYVTYREHSKTLKEVAIWFGRNLTVTGFAEPERVEGLSATFGLLPLLGVHPILGRAFTGKDDDDKSPEVVMLGYGYWQRRFGGDPKVIGRRIMADGAAREIIGVLPEKFWFMDVGHDLVLPLQFNRASVHLAGYNFRAVARLRPGVTIQQADADVARMIAIELRTFPPPNGMSTQMMEDARLAPNVRPLIDDLLGDIGNSLWVVMATIGIVLLIACANVANLLLVRAESRVQELAVRSALGASRGRIAREMLSESLALSVMGGCAGLVFAFAALRFGLTLSPARLPRAGQISLDSTALLFALAISLAAGLAFGAIPVLKLAGSQLGQSLRAGGRNASVGRERNIARNTLTAVQVGMALVLLVGSGLMIRTFQSMRRVHPGFSHPEGLQTLRVSIPRTAAPKNPDVVRIQHDLVDRLARIPGVSEVSLIGSLPMTGSMSQDPIFASDHTYAANQIPTLRRFITAAPGTFHALAVPMVAGREFTWTDIHESRPVAVISENFAREYWGSAQAAIGRQIRSNPADPWSEVVGVAGDLRHDGVDRKAPTSVYWPLRSSNSVAFLVRTARAGTESLFAEVRRTVWAVNGGLPITEMQTMKQVLDKSMARTGFTLTLLAISGGMALLLAVVGIYAVISYTVAQRTREIGIRIALGAQQAGLERLFVRRSLVWCGAGAAAGLAAAAVVSRLMSALLFEISPLDPLTYSIAAAGVLASAAVASYLPARRVTRVNPVEALRAD